MMQGPDRAASMNELSERAGSIAQSDDDASSCGGRHTHGTSATSKEAERATLARKENVVVIRMKGVVAAVLLAASILVSAGVYVYTHDDQVRDFEQGFKADASRLLDSFHKSLERTLEAIDALSVGITTHALETNSTFPFVTLPQFAKRFHNTRILSGSPFITYFPIVDEETRPAWEAYSKEHMDDYKNACYEDASIRAYQDVQFGRSPANPQDMPPPMTSEMIFNFGADGLPTPAPAKSGPYLPMYQISPVLNGLFNINAVFLPFLGRGFQEAIRTHQAVLDTAANLGAENNAASVFEAILAISQYRYNVSEYSRDPTSSFGYPVFDSFDMQKRKPMAVIGQMLYWRLYFKDILSSDTRGIHCVLSNTQGQVFTYEVGETVEFLGEGDHHDPKFDYMMEEGDLAAYIAKKASPETKSYTSVDLNTEFCSYKLRIYPSNATKNLHVNKDPLKVCLIVVSVFAFTSIVFVMYTIAVNRRQKVVMDRAVASSAIVSSLFPSQVRDQIYNENDAEQQQNTSGFDAKQTTDQDGGGGGAMGMFARPIAELYEHTTIMFGDLVGFTQWSSKRNPVAVFELLETIYKAFDAIAVRRKVFKVETIGDCYVAVTGLPEPQDDHAIIMARFAMDCMSKMRQLTTELASVLGEDTADLEMRIGLHSGPVTGGVLRGQKSRFQLFGDTMNTASRMESNGVRGRIHVSKETADELVAKGKSSWVTPRADKIVAKGKGELQTYWVSIRSTTGSIVSAATTTEQSFAESAGDTSECTA